MNQQIGIALEERTAVGSRAVSALRQQGYIPGVVYGNGVTAQTVMGPQIELARAFHQAGKHHPVELKLGDTTHTAMIKQVDVDPLKHQLRHIAFHVVKQNEKVETEVPVEITGKGSTPAERAGLVVLQAIEHVAIQAYPRDLPNALTLDGERLVAEGDHLTVADLAVPKGVEVTDDPDLTIASAVSTAALEAANDAAGGEAEPGDEENVVAEEGGEAEAV